VFRRSALDDKHDPYAALRISDFRLLIGSNFLASLAQAILSVIVGWELYLRTHSALALGLVGLVQVVPNVVMSIPAGQYVDRHDLKRIMFFATGLNALAAAGLALLSAAQGPLFLIYACLFFIGVGRAFRSPTQGVLLAAVIPPERFGNAAAWSGSAGQLASVLGPAIGGLGVAVFTDEAPVFAAAAVMLGVAAVAVTRLHPRPIERSQEKITVDSLLAGIRFIRDTKEMLAAITLDMVAVLLGGATALLPIFAEDVLHVGATGLGLMRAAPAAGAVLMSFAIAHRGPFAKAGPTLLATVAGFGLATIVFGTSRSMILSLGALAMLGAFDAISVVIRDTLELTFTPDHMRGRVGAVGYIFVGMSNEFGEFESGVAAAVLGATGAVIIGGIGTLLVVPLIALAWPEVRRLGRIVPNETPLPTPAPIATSD
jgi:MFS family permease